MKTRLRTMMTMLVLMVAIAGQARASNPIVDWNQIALTTALKQQVDESNKDILSVDMIRKA